MGPVLLAEASALVCQAWEKAWALQWAWGRGRELRRRMSSLDLLRGLRSVAVLVLRELGTSRNLLQGMDFTLHGS